ncbi:MAG: Gfo/Idh/MocA family oxidoreductase [Planctomycetota bacterium]
MTRPFRIGLVGAGRIASTWVDAVARLDGASLVGIADPRREAAASLAEAAGCPGFANDAELVAAVAPDALVVCTPPATHPEIAIRALRAGVPTIVEKPLAITREAAAAIAAASRECGTPFTMASKFRFVDDLVRARSLVATGALGRVATHHTVFTGRVEMRDRWNSDAAISGGGVLSDNGTHAFDVFRFLHGPIVAVHATAAPRLQEIPVEDTVRLLVRNAEGVLGLFDLSWSLPGGRENFVDVQGDDGCVEIGWRRSRWRRRGDQDWMELGPGYDKTAAFAAQLADFRDALREGRAPLVGPAAALASVAAVEAAYRSLDSGAWTAVEEPA